MLDAEPAIRKCIEEQPDDGCHSKGAAGGTATLTSMRLRSSYVAAKCIVLGRKGLPEMSQDLRGRIPANRVLVALHDRTHQRGSRRDTSDIKLTGRGGADLVSFPYGAIVSREGIRQKELGGLAAISSIASRSRRQGRTRDLLLLTVGQPSASLLREVPRCRHSGTNLSSASDLAILHSSRLNNSLTRLTQEKRVSRYPSADENG